MERITSQNVTKAQQKQKRCRKLPTNQPNQLHCKVCEITVKNFVLAHCEENNVFGEMQSAYRRNRCTTDNLLKLTQHLTEAFQWSEMVEFVCLDIEKAFDAVWRLGLQNKLLQIGMHKPLIK